MRTCPLGIQLILHFYYSPVPSDYRGTRVFEDETKKFLREGLIAWNWTYESYECTEKGKAWVDLICSTPYPHKREEWFDPRTNESIDRL